MAEYPDGSRVDKITVTGLLELDIKPFKETCQTCGGELSYDGGNRATVPWVCSDNRAGCVGALFSRVQEKAATAKPVTPASRIIEQLLALPEEQRRDVCHDIRFNGVFCFSCGAGSRERPNANCQCENDD